MGDRNLTFSQPPVILMNPPTPTSPSDNKDKIVNIMQAPSANSSFLLGAELKPQQLPTLKAKRNRELVNPGKSMVEWMRKQAFEIKSPIRLRDIGFDELETHSKEGDVWMAIQDKVFDVTEYAYYHPGGFTELMKGAGADGTSLFNSIHRWVNFESILKGKQVGYLVRRKTLGTRTEVSSSSLLSASQITRFSQSSKLLPTIDMSQDDFHVFCQVDSMEENNYSPDCWTVGILGRERLLMKVVLKPPELWVAHMQLLEALNDDAISLSFQNNFKRLLLTIRKPKQGAWKALGAPLSENNKIMDSRGAMEDMHDAVILQRQILTQNVILMTVRVNTSAHVGVPVGFHVKIRVNGKSRRYTPVCYSVIESGNPPFSSDKGQILYFIVKVYEGGEFTPVLRNLPLETQAAETTLQVGCSSGNFTTKFFTNVECLLLLAAGSGITPFARIIKYAVECNDNFNIKRIMLVFFNQTDCDIIWRDQWEKLAESEPYFYFIPILSQPPADWNGFKGRVSGPIIQQCLDSVQDKVTFTETKVMICGSDAFNAACEESVMNAGLKLSEKEIHIFAG